MFLSTNVFTVVNMSSKKEKRLEAKKRKAAAFLEVARLNDKDREVKVKQEDVLDKEPPSKKAKKSDNAAPVPPPRYSSKPLLAGADYQTLKAELRARKKALKSLPRFDLKSGGHDASVDVLRTLRTPLFPSDLQSLLAYTMVGDRVPCGPFRWCKVEKWNRLTGVLCLVVEGLGVTDFEENRDKECVARIEKIFPHKLEFLSPSSYGSTVARDLSFLPVGCRKRKTLARTFGGMEQMLERGAAFRVNRAFFPIKKKEKHDKEEEKVKVKEEPEEAEEECLKLRLLMSAKQMVQENYPLPLSTVMRDRYSDYVLTSDEYDDASPESPLFSVDCEMCMTTRRKMELTRICVVDSDLKVVYHTLVKPEARITNYLTRFSGITEQMLSNVETRLSDVQRDLRRLLPQDAILVGQSLHSDLHALRMMHPYVIDTSVIYNLTGVRSRKTKLQVLAARFLGQSIQQDGKHGHSPIEDAQAAMNLVKLKLEKGYEFGDVLLDGTTESIRNSVKKEGDKSDSDSDEGDKKEEDKEEDDTVLATTLLAQIRENNKKARVVCQKGLGEEYGEVPGSEDLVEECKEGSSSSSSSSKAAVKRAAAAAHEYDLVVCHVRLSEGKSVEKRLERAAAMAERLWGHTSRNSMMFTVWAGSQEQNAMVGVAMNRGPIPGVKKEEEKEEKE